MDTSQCTLAICPIELSRIGYLPNVGGNMFLAVWFGLLLLVQLGLAIRHKTWSYLFGQACGLILELIGYVARVRLHEDPFDNTQFIVYIVTITIAPAFLCFTVYLCFGRIVLVYGPHLSRISHRAYTVIFVTMDVICLVLQAGGAAWTQADNITSENLDRALKVLRAGLGMQCASLAVFILLSLDLGIRMARCRGQWSTRYEHVRGNGLFNPFLICSFGAAVLVLVRSAFRVQELSNGFAQDQDPARAQTLFMIFEGGMIGLAALLQAAFHPGPVFGLEWLATRFSSKQGQGEAQENGKRDGGNITGSGLAMNSL